MHVREARPEDLGGILRLYAQLNPDDPVVLDGRDVEVFGAIAASPYLSLFAGVADGDVIATCYLNVIPNLSRGVSPYAVLENVVVDEGSRGQGHGRAIVGHALDAAWSRGCYKVMLQTGSRREATHAFYRRCGFSGDERFAFVARRPRDVR